MEHVWDNCTVIKSQKFRKCSNCGKETQYLDYCCEAGICSEKCYKEYNSKLSEWAQKID